MGLRGTCSSPLRFLSSPKLNKMTATHLSGFLRCQPRGRCWHSSTHSVCTGTWCAWRSRGSPRSCPALFGASKRAASWGDHEKALPPTPISCCGSIMDQHPCCCPPLRSYLGHTSCVLLPANGCVQVATEAHFWDIRTLPMGRLLQRVPVSLANLSWNWLRPSLPVLLPSFSSSLGSDQKCSLKDSPFLHHFPH